MIYQDPGTDDNMRQRLIQHLSSLHGGGGQGNRGGRFLPLFGGGGRQATDLPQARMPNLTYNPFLSMLTGRPGENFQNLPPGLSQNQAAAFQNMPSASPGTGPGDFGLPPQASGGGATNGGGAPRHEFPLTPANDPYGAGGQVAAPSMQPDLFQASQQQQQIAPSISHLFQSGGDQFTGGGNVTGHGFVDPGDYYAQLLGFNSRY